VPPPLAIAATTQVDLDRAVAELRAALAPIDPALVLAFHSPSHPAQMVATAMAAAFPGAHTAGCSTMGELSEGRFVRGGISAIAFGPQARVGLECIEDVQAWRYEEGAALVGRICTDLGCAPASLRSDRHVFLTLVDGLSGADERILSSVAELAPGVPLVGGCAADDEHFNHTWVFSDGVAAQGGAILLLLEPGLPFRPFAIHHFRPTGQRVVITRADPAHRLVIEINGWPALREYARLCGLPMESFRQHPDLIHGQNVQFGSRALNTSFLRGVMTARGTDLVLAGAVEEGAILDVLEAVDLVESTRQGLQEELSKLPGSDAALMLFSCGGRYHAADRAGVLADLAQAMTPVPAAGFSTYGEHFGDILVSFSLTGVAFALPSGSLPSSSLPSSSLPSSSLPSRDVA